MDDTHQGQALRLACTSRGALLALERLRVHLLHWSRPTAAHVSVQQRQRPLHECRDGVRDARVRPQRVQLSQCRGHRRHLLWRHRHRSSCHPPRECARGAHTRRWGRALGGASEATCHQVGGGGVEAVADEGCSAERRHPAAAPPQRADDHFHNAALPILDQLICQRRFRNPGNAVSLLLSSCWLVVELSSAGSEQRLQRVQQLPVAGCQHVATGWRRVQEAPQGAEGHAGEHTASQVGCEGIQQGCAVHLLVVHARLQRSHVAHAEQRGVQELEPAAGRGVVDASPHAAAATTLTTRPVTCDNQNDGPDGA